MQHCSACWNPINWCESFAKFGHGDGEDCIHTNLVAAVLRKAGYLVVVHDRTLHNPIIVDIREERVPGDVRRIYWDGIPEGNQPGYTDPRKVLPSEMVALLDQTFGPGDFYI